MMTRMRRPMWWLSPVTSGTQAQQACVFLLWPCLVSKKNKIFHHIKSFDAHIKH